MALTSGALTGPEIAREYADAILYTVRREKREAMTSPLYDLPGRSALGFEVIRATAPDLLRGLARRTTPEEIGLAMREPLMRPYLLQPFILMEGYFVGREQDRIRAELEGRDWDPEADAPDADLVATWYGRICAAYRTDDHVFPGKEVKDQPVLEQDRVAEIAVACAAPAGDEIERSRQVFGTLELYALTLHGEQRDGICDHGPYDLGGGGLLVMHEINDLANDYLPWSEPDVRLPVDAVGVARVHEPVGTEFDMFGTMNYTEPSVETREHCFWIREGAQIRSATLDELEEVAAAARPATAKLFKSVAGWDERFRTAYGGPLFANHLLPFVRLAGATDLESPFAEAVDVATEAAMAWIRDTTGPVWRHFSTARDGNEFFRPFAGS